MITVSHYAIAQQLADQQLYLLRCTSIIALCIEQPNTTLHDCIMRHSMLVISGSADQCILGHVSLEIQSIKVTQKCLNKIEVMPGPKPGHEQGYLHFLWLYCQCLLRSGS